MITTDSGIPVDPWYGPPEEPGPPLGPPGEPPYTRGPYASMYRERLWTMRQYAGFGSAEDTNARFRYLLSQGQTALSVAFDLPTQLGYDSSHELASNEVGRVGVAIDTADDMAAVFDGLPLEDLSVNFTINATAPIILAFYIVAAERRGVDPARLAGTLQNDILKEFLARKLYVFPPQPSLQLTGDVVEYCARELPRFNPISITGYHAREAGCDAIQEIGLTMASAIAYAEHFTARGLAFDSFAPRLSFHFSSQLDLFEEAAKVRAARGLWYDIATERFGAANPHSGRLRFFSGCSGATLTAQQPLNNVVRSTLQCLAAVLGGAQSIHVMGYDEALEIPTEESVRLALRTQQIIAHESGVTRTVNPLAGSYFVESLTSELRTRALATGAGGGRRRRLRAPARAGCPAAVDRRGRLPQRTGHPVRRAGQGRGEPVHRRRRGPPAPAVRGGHHGGRPAAGPAGHPAGRARRWPGGPRAHPGQGGGNGGREHHAGLPRRGPGGLHRRRDHRRAPRRVRRAPGTSPMVTPPAAKPLAGIRVLDLTRFVSGAYCTMVLDALGADVIKVEGLPGGDPYRAQGAVRVGSLSGLFASLNTGKRSIAVDLTLPDGSELVRTLARRSDVFVENARPGSLERAGLGPDRLHALNPRLVYASISGFGQTGPDAGRGGFDLILQAASGIMAVTGTEAGGPVKVGAPVLDIGSGMSAATAIIAALFARTADGLGRTVSSSLLEFALGCFTSYAADMLETGTSPGLLGNDSPQFAPYGVFRCRDGSLALAGAGSEPLWLKLCDVLGRPDWAADPRFATNADRLRHRAELTARDRADPHPGQRRVLAAGPGRGRDPGLPGPAARRGADLGAGRSPWRSARRPAPRTATATRRSARHWPSPTPGDSKETLGYSRGAPGLGQHTAEILAGAGLATAEIEDLTARGVVAG